MTKRRDTVDPGYPCEYCKGRGFNWVSIGPDDCEKESCDYCDGVGRVDVDGNPLKGVLSWQDAYDLFRDL